MGKVHGSLARAGKVKSQTPKVSSLVVRNRSIAPFRRMIDLTATLQVEKAETPKTPKGRAHKREQYTRRFVNVTTAPGGKRKVGLGWQGWCGHTADMVDLQMNPNPGS